MERYILIVEDDTSINNLLKEAIEKENFICEQAFSGTEAKLLLDMKEYTLVLLDLMLPGISGEEVLGYIRQKGNIPVIVLTAKDSIDDKIDVLSLGADDYITKPFDIKEVIARIKVQLRHLDNTGDDTKNKSKDVISYKDITLDKNNFTVKVEGKELPKLTKQEFAILELLIKNPKRAFTKEEIFEYAWEEPYIGETKTLDVHISNIRKKIKTLTQVDCIETVWGIGYKLY